MEISRRFGSRKVTRRVKLPMTEVRLEYVMVAKIVKCGSDEAEACPGDWGQLNPTGDRMIRHCSECMRTVYCCESAEEIVARQDAGQCVALAS